MLIPVLFILLAPIQTENELWALEAFTPPSGEVLEVGGMDFDSKNVLWLSTRRGQVWRVENVLADDPKQARWTLWAEGLVEGLGLKVVDDVVWVVQRDELSRLLDVDGDGLCDTIDTISQGWGMSGNYHEFAFGLPVDNEGNFYVTTNVGFWSPEWWHGLSKVPWRGWVLRISPTGTVTPVASGVRSPSGLGRDVDGNIWYTDNQGDWMPVCGVFPVQDGSFFGHPASLRWTEDYDPSQGIPSSTVPPERNPDPAAIWIPYEWSRSTGNLVADDTTGQFGPFAGQLFTAELTLGQVLRLQPEKIGDTWQGAVFPFRKDLGSVCRVRFASDGSLFLGYTNRGWGGRPPADGLARLRWNGETPNEISSVHLLADGFRLRFTKPIPKDVDPSSIAVRSYDYNWWWDYGSPEMRNKVLEVSEAFVSKDGMELDVRIPGLEGGTCVRIGVTGLGLLHEEFAYTINHLPGRSVIPVAKRVAPPKAKALNDDGWLHLTWGDATGLWEGQGWQLGEISADPENPSRFAFGRGNSALVNFGENPGDFRSTPDFGDMEFRFSVQLPKGGDSGLYFMDRYEMQLNDNASWFGGIWETKNPRAQGWRGPHEWHVVTGTFYTPRFNEQGEKIRHARFENVEVDDVLVLGAAECENGPTGGGAKGEVSRGPLRFQGNMGHVAIADVRVRPLEPRTNIEGWDPLADEGVMVEGDFKLHAQLSMLEGQSYLRVGDEAVAIRTMGDATVRTGALVSSSPFAVELIPPGTPFTLDLTRSGEMLTVSLNGIQINQTNIKPGPLHLGWDKADGDLSLSGTWFSVD